MLNPSLFNSLFEVRKLAKTKEQKAKDAAEKALRTATSPEEIIKAKQQLEKLKSTSDLDKDAAKAAHIEQEVGMKDAATDAFNAKRDAEASTGKELRKKDSKEIAAQRKAAKEAGEEDPYVHPEQQKYKDYKRLKAEYGTYYFKTKPNLDDFYRELQGIAFRVKKLTSLPYFELISNTITSNKEAFTSVEQDPAFENLLQELANPQNYILDSHKIATNAISYVLYCVFVLPMLSSDLISLMFRTPNVVNFFNTLSQNYSGDILNPIEFSPESNFRTLEHIKNENVKELASSFESVLHSTDPEQADLQRVLNSDLQIIANDLKNKCGRSVYNNKYGNEITRTIYYSLFSSIAPYNLDLFELDDEKLKNNIASNRLQKDDFLTDNAEILASNLSQIIQESPLLHRGILGSNSKDRLAFEYAKASQLLQKHKKNTPERKADVAKSINEGMTRFFKSALQNMPTLGPAYNQLDAVLDSFFKSDQLLDKLEASNGVSVEQLSTEATDKLHAFAENCLTCLSNDLQNQKAILSVFDTLIKKTPRLADDYTEETDKISYITDIYLNPFKDVMVRQLHQFQALTAEDITILMKTASDIIKCENNIIKVFQLKPTIEQYKQHRNSAELTSNSFRFEGFAFFSSILNLDKLLLKANKMIRRPVSIFAKKEEEDSESKLDKEMERDSDYLQQMQTARRRIINTRHLLIKLPSIISRLVMEIRKPLDNLNDTILTSLVTGTKDLKELTQVSEFFSDIIDKITSTFFNSESGYNLLLLSNDKIDIETAKATIIKELTEKVKLSILATPGTFHAYTDSYPGLTDDFIDFVNLAASINKEYSGLEVDANGKPDMTFGVDPSSKSNAFFTKFFFGELAQYIEQNPTIKLCVHKFILNRFRTVFTPLLTKVSVNNILGPEVRKGNPEATKQIAQYFKDLAITSDAGLTEAIDAINSRILEYAGGSTQFLILNDTLAFPFPIPDKLDEQFEFITSRLGNKAYGQMIRTSNVKSAAQLFLNIVARATEGAEEPALVQRIESAINIISTAINLKAAKVEMIGDDASEQKLVEILNMFRKDGEEFKVDDTLNKKDTLNKILNTYSFATSPKQGIQAFYGTELISQKDNRISNPLLAGILDKFDGFVSKECINQEIDRYAAELQQQRQEGTADLSEIGSFLPKLGIIYKGTNEYGDIEGQEEPTPEETPEGAEPSPELIRMNSIFARDEAGVLHFTPQNAKRITKELFSRVTGTRTTTLGKDKRPHEAEAPVQAYSEKISTLKNAITSATSIYINLLNEVGSQEDASLLKENLKASLTNCSIMDSFYNILKRFQTHDIYNLGIQHRLLQTLSTLEPDAAISYKDISVISGVGEQIVASDNRLPHLLKVVNFAGNASINAEGDEVLPKNLAKLESLFGEIRGLEQVFILLGKGYSIGQIEAKVEQLLQEHGTDENWLQQADMDISEFRNSGERAKTIPSEVRPTPSHQEPQINEREQKFVSLLATNFPIYNTTKDQVLPPLANSMKKKPRIIPGGHTSLNQNFIDRYVTLLDPKTYSSPLISDETKAACRQAASKLHSEILKAVNYDISTKAPNPDLINDIQTAVTNGNGHNLLLGNPVTSVISPANGMREGNLFILKLALLEASQNEIPSEPTEPQATPTEQPVSTPEQPQETSEEKPKESLDDSLFNSLAAILLIYHKVQYQNGLKANNGGRVFQFITTNTLWALQKFNPELAQALKIVNRYMEAKDTLEFELYKPSKTTKEKNVYIKIFYFNSLKLVIDTNYKPINLEAEPKFEKEKGSKPAPEIPNISKFGINEPLRKKKEEEAKLNTEAENVPEQ